MKNLALAVLAQAVKDAVRGDANAIRFLRGDDVLLRFWSDAAGVPLDKIRSVELSSDLIASRLAVVRTDARRLRKISRWSAVE